MQTPLISYRLEYVAGAAFYVLVTAVLTYPLSLSPGTLVMDLGPDTRLFLWTLGWDWHALANDPWHLFDANILFPTRQSLALSEHLVGAALVGAPLQLLFGDAVLTMNLIAMGSIALSGFATYVFARQLGVGVVGAVCAGCVFAFAPPRFFRIGQLHLTSVQWLPLCLAAIHHYLVTRSRWPLLGAVVCFTLQAWSSGQGALFLLLAVAIVVPLSGGRKILRWGRALVDLGVACGVLLALNIPLLLPYVNKQRDEGLVRTIDDAARWEPTTASFLAAPTHSQGWILEGLGVRQPVMRDANSYLFPGFIALMLAAAGILLRSGRAPNGDARESAPADTRYNLAPWLAGVDIAIGVCLVVAIWIEAAGGVDWPSVGFRASGSGRALAAAAGLAALRLLTAGLVGSRVTRRLASLGRWWQAFWAGRGDRRLGAYVALGLIATWASLGPSLGLYRVLYRLIPGFDFIRVPSRLTLLSLVALAIIAGFGADKLFRQVQLTGRRFAKAAGLAVVLALLLEYAAMPLAARPFQLRSSSLDQWIVSSESNGPLAHVPSPDPRDEIPFAQRQTTYMMYSMSHFRPMVNGYSGFIPSRQDALLRQLAAFPSEATLDALASVGVRHLLVHRDGYTPAEWEGLIERLGDEPRLQKRFEDPDGLVMELRGIDRELSR